VLTGGRFVADTHRGRVLQFDGGDEQGVWLIADKHTVMVKDVSRSKTVSFWINPAETKTARVLYAEGNPAIGANVYLDNGCVFAGAWNRGGDAPWDGTWIQSAPISANEWTEITFAMKADEPAGKMRMTLHTDGDHAGDAEGKLLESRYTPPRIGTFVTNRSGILMTRFHDGMRKADVVGRFRGFLDDFALVSSSDAKPHAAP
jgi:hypothetical protein